MAKAMKKSMKSSMKKAMVSLFSIFCLKKIAIKIFIPSLQLFIRVSPCEIMLKLCHWEDAFVFFDGGVPPGRPPVSLYSIC